MRPFFVLGSIALSACGGAGGNHDDVSDGAVADVIDERTEAGAADAAQLDATGDAAWDAAGDAGPGAEGHVRVLAAGQGTPQAIAVDEASVYWTDSEGFDGGAVLKVSLDGGTPVVLAAAQARPFALALHGGDVVWTDFAPGRVWRVPVEGGVPVLIAVDPYHPQTVATDQTNVYWTEANGPNHGFDGESVMKAPEQMTTTIVATADGGTATVTDGGVATAIATKESSPLGIAVDETHAYWSSLAGAILSAPLDGGARAVIADHVGAAYAVAVDAQRVYWVTSLGADGGAVMSAPKVPGDAGASVVLASGLAEPQYIAIDAQSVYWTNGGDGTVMKVSLQGGSPVVLAAGQDHPQRIAVDSTSVYWINQGTLDAGFRDGTVMKLTPK